MVIFFHIMETYSKGPAFQIINHGYLAVDFFFVLSGFVIGYAYDDRWDKMSTWGFFKRRLVRLHPMLIMGTIVGACFYFFGQCPQFGLEGYANGWKFLAAFVLALFMIPVGPGLDVRGWGEMNPLNGPQWSLTYEYIGNILYAFIFRKLPNFALAVLTGAAAFCTLDLCLNLNVFGLLTEGRNYAVYTVIGGWSLAPEQIYIGFTRLLYPFLSGLLLSRIGKKINVKGGFWWCSLILVTIFCIPCIGGPDNIMNGVYNAACILFLFPLVVMMGAGSHLKGEKSARICTFLGEISYPIYITHYPVLYMQMNWAWNHMDAPIYAHVVVAISSVLISIGLAYACLKLYDLPVRKWLTENWLKK
jgi:peptidoglycan/LPS O-acetylase OafA/YrhL